MKTVFLTMRHALDNMEARQRCMDMMRELFRHFIEIGLSQLFTEYGLWQDFGAGKEIR